MTHCCFKQNCKHEVEYVCQCLYYLTYSCEYHLQLHLELPNRTHSLESVLTEPFELTKKVILKFLSKEKYKKDKLKSIALSAFNQNSNNTENNININLNDLNFDLEEIRYLIEKISQVSEEELLLNSLKSQCDTNRESIQLKESEKYSGLNLFCRLGQLKNKRYEILYKANNYSEEEQNFRRTCSLYENHTSNFLLNQAYQEYIKDYQKIASTYLISKKPNLYIYNTETEKEEAKVLETKVEIKPSNSLTLLPNGELFLVSWDESSNFAFIIDKNYQIRNLPHGVPSHCFGAIYFNRSVYCFGGNYGNSSSRKFDLDENRWTELIRMREDIGEYFNCAIFNRNILISINYNSEILSYSIDIDSFSEISYSFPEDVKILINAEERIYLIGCNNGWIYESGIRDEYNWKRIANSIIEDYPEQVYCSYNKRSIYISILYPESRAYFKFDLNQKKLIDIAFYSKHFGIKRSGDKLKAIKSYENTFTLNPNHAAIYVDKGYNLYYIVRWLEEIERNNKEIDIYRDNKDSDFYMLALSLKGGSLLNLGRNFEAIKCYNKAVKINLNKLRKTHEATEHNNEIIKIIADLASAYTCKGIALVELGRPHEAIEYHNEAIQLEPDNPSCYFIKGNALEKANRHHEAIECYKTAINLNPRWAECYNNIGISLQNLERNLEAIEYYNEAIEIDPNFVDAHNNKGNALLKLGRHVEAIECYSFAIKLEPDNAEYYLNKGNALSDFGKNIEAIECYNKAIIIKSNDARAYSNKGKSLMILGRNIEALECFNEAIKFKPDNAITYNNKGEALFNLDRSIEAIECYSEAIKLKIDEPSFYYNRANALNKVDRQIEALQDLNKADDLVKANKV